MVNFAVAREESLPGDDLVDETPEGPDVYLVTVDRLPEDVLGRFVPHAACLAATAVALLRVLGRLGAVREVDLAAEHQVADADALDVADGDGLLGVVQVHEDVFGLEVAVDDLLVVQLVHAARDREY